jgi:hypothetical protein
MEKRRRQDVAIIVGITFQLSFELSISNLEAYMRYECAVHLEEINNLGVVIP